MFANNLLVRCIILLKPFYITSWKHSASLFLVLCLPFISVYFNYKLNLMSQVIIDVLQTKGIYIIIPQLIIASGIAISFGIFVAFRRYIEERISISIRKSLYLHYNKASLDDNKCETSSQRMDANLAQLPTSFINLSTSFLETLISLPTFMLVLYNIAGSVAVLCAMGYAIFGNYISKMLSKSFIKIVNIRENISANFRKELIQEATKSIDKRELPNINPVIDISNSANNYSFFLVSFRNIFGHLKSYFPYVFLLYKYIEGVITLGQITRCIGAFRYVMQSFAFFTDNRINIAQLNVTVQRVYELNANK